MFRVTERSLNRTLSPLINSKGKSVTFPYTVPGKKLTYQNFFTEKHFAIIDFFASNFMNYYANELYPYDEFKLSPYDDKIMKTGLAILTVGNRFVARHEDRCPEVHQSNGIDSSLKISAMDIKKSEFGKFTVSEIDAIIQDFATNPIKLKMPVRYLDFNFKKYKLEKCLTKSRLIHLASRVENRGSDGRLVNVDYEIEFTTELGQMFISNLCSINVDQIPDGFYELSKYAQCLYRRFIVHVLRLKHSNEPITLSMDRIKMELGLTIPNVTRLRDTISLWLDEMVPNIINRWSFDKSKKMFTIERNQ